jgi:hypothetical protein
VENETIKKEIPRKGKASISKCFCNSQDKSQQRETKGSTAKRGKKGRCK